MSVDINKILIEIVVETEEETVTMAGLLGGPSATEIKALPLTESDVLQFGFLNFI